MSRIEVLKRNYQRICGLPSDRNVAGSQRVWFVVYDKEDERKLRLPKTANLALIYDWPRRRSYRTNLN